MPHRPRAPSALASAIVGEKSCPTQCVATQRRKDQQRPRESQRDGETRRTKERRREAKRRTLGRGPFGEDPARTTRQRAVLLFKPPFFSLPILHGSLQRRRTSGTAPLPCHHRPCHPTGHSARHSAEHSTRRLPRPRLPHPRCSRRPQQWPQQWPPLRTTTRHPASSNAAAQQAQARAARSASSSVYDTHGERGLGRRCPSRPNASPACATSACAAPASFSLLGAFRDGRCCRSPAVASRPPISTSTARPKTRSRGTTQLMLPPKLLRAATAAVHPPLPPCTAPRRPR